jgi:hypothetical protein
MKRTTPLFGLFGFLLLTTAAAGQTVPSRAVVTEDVTEVRCGPRSDPRLYATNLLRRGAVVEVVAERDGWLGIEPPPGSFSWISTRSVQRVGESKVWVVVPDPETPVTVLVGSDLVDEEPTVEGVRVSRGTQVVQRGKEQATADGTWLPIEPPRGEVRWVRADAVRRLTAAESAPDEDDPDGWPGRAKPAGGPDGGRAVAKPRRGPNDPPPAPTWTNPR